MGNADGVEACAGVTCWDVCGPLAMAGPSLGEEGLSVSLVVEEIEFLAEALPDLVEAEAKLDVGAGCLVLSTSKWSLIDLLEAMAGPGLGAALVEPLDVEPLVAMAVPEVLAWPLLVAEVFFFFCWYNIIIYTTN